MCLFHIGFNPLNKGIPYSPNIKCNYISNLFRRKGTKDRVIVAYETVMDQGNERIQLF